MGITEWQKRLKAQPRVYWVEDQGEMTGCGFYDDKAGAEMEAAFHNRNRTNKNRIKVRCSPVQSMGLARDRWEKYYGEKQSTTHE